MLSNDAKRLDMNDKSKWKYFKMTHRKTKEVTYVRSYDLAPVNLNYDVKPCSKGDFEKNTPDTWLDR
jgi:hypothetical protein